MQNVSIDLQPSLACKIFPLFCCSKKNQATYQVKLESVQSEKSMSSCDVYTMCNTFAENVIKFRLLAKTLCIKTYLCYIKNALHQLLPYSWIGI